MANPCSTPAPAECVPAISFKSGACWMPFNRSNSQRGYRGALVPFCHTRLTGMNSRR